MTIDSLHATARLLVFGSLWGMTFSLVPCCTFWMFMETSVPVAWSSRMGPNVWIGVWFLMQAFFAVLMLRAHMQPVVCGALGSVLYLPALLPAAAMVWQFATGGRSRGWSIVDLYSVVPVALHFGLVSATAVAYTTAPGTPRRANDTEYDDDDP